jgi:L-ascorbate metabolism protein UlaG (beta-lactamase superfamily)
MKSGTINQKGELGMFTRRTFLGCGSSAVAMIGVTAMLPVAARAQSGAMNGNTFAVEDGEIRINPVSHASFVMETPGLVIYSDPVGGAELYAGLPSPDLVLVTHAHGDHYNAETLAALVGEKTRLITNPSVHGMLPDDLKSRATAMGNGDSREVDSVAIDAVPAYNTTEDRLKFHPKGRDNGYVLQIGGTRVYIAGDTEDIPEMRALENIDIAFLPMNLPYTMSVEQAASAVAEFAPRYVYPYHYKGSDIDRFASLVAESGSGSEVKRGDWYGE